jgi:alpha-beta hydrolase superfamily lysophospholipase
MEQRVHFKNSQGQRLAGIVHVPDDLKAGQRRAGFLVLHGFGSNKDSSSMIAVAKALASYGYVAMRFDMRGCGESEGAKGRVICLEQVEDARSALAYLATLDEVRDDRIGVLGHSFGAAVAVYAAGVEKRFAACVSSGGWGDGETKFRKQHESPEAWKRFSDMLKLGREKLARGESMLVPRYDIVPIRPELRTALAPGSVLEFPFEVVESMYTFKANEVVGRIAPRPLLLLHPAKDSVTPTEQSIELFRHAGQPTELHLVAGVDHFLWSEGNARVFNLLRDWLNQNIPAK